MKFLAPLALALVFWGCAPETNQSRYDACVQEASQAPTEAGVLAAISNCDDRFQRERIEQTEPEISEGGSPQREVYWYGWGYRSGPLPPELAAADYREYEVARYGVPLCIVHIPQELAESMRIEEDPSEWVSPEIDELFDACRE